MRPPRDDLEIAKQHQHNDVECTIEQINGNEATSKPPTDQRMKDGTDDSEKKQYATAQELALLSTCFTIATFMIAIDGSILGKSAS